MVFDNHNQAVGLLFSGGEATPISYFTHWRDLAKHIVLVTRHELFLLNTFHASRMCLKITEFYFHPYLISMPDPHENDPGCRTLALTKPSEIVAAIKSENTHDESVEKMRYLIPSGALEAEQSSIDLGNWCDRALLSPLE